MGDFGGSGYRAEKIVKKVYGTNAFSKEANNLKEIIQKSIQKHGLDYPTLDEELLRRGQDE